jgi:hypothetical protein
MNQSEIANAKLFFPLRLIISIPLCLSQPKGGDYSYSGMHDHGPLPAPKEGGEFSLLIDIVQQAKKNSDELLTKIIQEEKNAGRREQTNVKGKKKQKMGE